MYLINENKCSMIKAFECTNNSLHITTEKQSIYITFENKNDIKAAYDYLLKCLKLTHLASMKHLKDMYPEMKVMVC